MIVTLRVHYYNSYNSQTGTGNFTAVSNNFSPTLFIADNAWHHVAMVVDVSGMKLYLDGILSHLLPGQVARQPLQLIHLYELVHIPRLGLI